MGYKHLTREQRYTIAMLLQTPMSLREIGEVIGVSTGTVSREIRRNAPSFIRYLAQKEQRDSLLFLRSVTSTLLLLSSHFEGR